MASIIKRKNSYCVVYRYTEKANHTSVGNHSRLTQKRGNEKIKLSTNRTTMFLPFPKQELSENCL